MCPHLCTNMQTYTQIRKNWFFIPMKMSGFSPTHLAWERARVNSKVGGRRWRGRKVNRKVLQLWGTYIPTSSSKRLGGPPKCQKTTHSTKSGGRYKAGYSQILTHKDTMLKWKTLINKKWAHYNWSFPSQLIRVAPSRVVRGRDFRLETWFHHRAVESSHWREPPIPLLVKLWFLSQVCLENWFQVWFVNLNGPLERTVWKFVRKLNIE